ncbi:cyclic peptide export ABC transporter [Pedobacter endophyticus]|uniref:Cyclic peptide export ABC transporter n=1 Tax=Pedobacter endophyticus TaxID=2789740 RepID=A0A7U3Q462_9SPHI|nr:cyclic peptide export ABC transporter [Pedobacter endophyticus]QPH38259.1 cyclic peptide export ABC transporter [Pedobacter endophyticus]
MRDPIISKLNFIKVFLLGTISSSLTLGFISLVNLLINKQVNDKALVFELKYCLFLIVLIGLYALTRIYFSFSTIKLSQHLFWKLRVEVVRIMSDANFNDFKRHSHKITACLISDVSILTQSAEHCIYFLTSLLTMILCMAYLAYLSILLFILTLIVIVSGAFIYRISFKRNQFFLKAARNEEEQFVSLLDSLINGFKEISLDRHKKTILGQVKLEQIAERSIGLNIKAFTGISLNQLTGQILFFTLILSVLMFFNNRFGLPMATSINFVFILLFLRSAIETTMALLPGLYQANIAYKRVVDLRDTFSTIFNDHPITKKEVFDNFSRIKVQDLKYTYPTSVCQENGFGIGPIDLEIGRGNVYFIYGGNGSGKTTFMLLLLGLLKPGTGQVYVDDVLIGFDNIGVFKMLFGAVFSDYYLFDQVFNPEVDPIQVQEYLTIFELNDKVGWQDNVFTTRGLSMGQRKRLALVCVLLENKPIVVLDEWAADQDPYFRKKFYEEIIPLLKRKGFTIIAITHDDKYYYFTDYIYKMQEGKLIRVTHENPNFIAL